MNILLEMTLSGALLVGVIIIIRALAMHRLPKRAFIVLWFIALFQLVVPFSVPSQMSIFNLFDASNRIQQITMPPDMPNAANAEISDFQRRVYGYFPVLNAPVENVNQTRRIVLEPIVSAYLFGVIIAAVLFTLLYNKHRKDFDNSLPISNEFITNWLASHKLKRRISIRVSDKIAAPLTYGIFRPVILLPTDTDWGNENELNYVLAHELIHIKRFDALTKLVMMAVLCIHWFNPLVWGMYFLFNRDLEISCDEAVINMLGEKSKQGYALTLIGMIERKNHFPALYNNFGKYAIEERITAIMKMKKRTIFGTLAALLVVGVTATVFATSRANESPHVTNTPQYTLQPAAPPEDLQAETPLMGTPTYPTSQHIIWPLESNTRLSSPFGFRINPVSEREEFHTGIDIPAPEGTPIFAVKDGYVISAASTDGWLGYAIVLDHGGAYSTVYAHVSAIHVEEGQFVRQGEFIANVGSTGEASGPHLHFEIRVDGRSVDPLDFYIEWGDLQPSTEVWSPPVYRAIREFPIYEIEHGNINFIIHHTYHNDLRPTPYQLSLEDAAKIAADAIYEEFDFCIDGMTGYMHFNRQTLNFWMGFIMCEELTTHSHGDELLQFAVCAVSGDILSMSKNTVESPFLG